MPQNFLVISDDDYKAAASLFGQYATWLNIDLSFQHFEEELLQIKKIYGPPDAGIILCKQGSEYAGCIAIRKQEIGVAEIKRMYVKPEFQKRGIGNTLLHDALALAKKYHYKKARLDTLSYMTPAMELYKKNGFYEISAYYYNPESTAVYFEKIL